MLEPHDPSPHAQDPQKHYCGAAPNLVLRMVSSVLLRMSKRAGPMVTERKAGTARWVRGGAASVGAGARGRVAEQKPPHGGLGDRVEDDDEDNDGGE